MFTINIDYGANSVRALVVRSADGAEFVGAVVGYPSGDEGVRLDARQAVYDKLYALYRQLHGSFGRLNNPIDLSRFMKALIEIKYAQQG